MRDGQSPSRMQVAGKPAKELGNYENKNDMRDSGNGGGDDGIRSG